MGRYGLPCAASANTAAPVPQQCHTRPPFKHRKRSRWHRYLWLVQFISLCGLGTRLLSDIRQDGAFPCGRLDSHHIPEVGGALETTSPGGHCRWPGCPGASVPHLFYCFNCSICFSPEKPRRGLNIPKLG